MGMKVYIDDVEETTAIKPIFTNYVNAIGQASFVIPNPHLNDTNTLYDTWVSYIDTVDVKIYCEDVLKFEGYVKSVRGDRDLLITCEDVIGKFTWYYIPDAHSQFKLFSGKVESAPSTYVNCDDEDGDDPAFENDEFNGKYLILSDATKGISDIDIEWSYSGNMIVGQSEYSAYLVNQANDYHAVKSGVGDSTKWEEISYNSSTGWKAMLLGIDLVDYVIQKTAIIDHIDFTFTFTSHCTIALGSNRSNQWGYVYVGGSLGTETNFQRMHNQLIHYPVLNGTEDRAHTFQFSLTVRDNWDKFFTKGDSYYEGGYFGILVESVLDKDILNNPRSYVTLKWAGCTITIYYDTAEFDILNETIVDTVSTKRIDVTTNLSTLGVAVGDSVQVGETMDNAYLKLSYSTYRVPSHLPAVYTNNGVAISRGIAEDYSGITAYSLLTTLNRLNTFEMFLKYDDNTLQCLKEEDIALDGGTLTGFTDIGEMETQNNVYGNIDVWWSGQTEGTNPAQCSTGIDNSDNDKTYGVKRSDILSYAKAIEVAEELAVKYGSFHRSIPLTFDLWTDLKCGYLYTFTINGVEYADQICRRVTVSYDNGQYHIVGYFGGGETPPNEKIGMTIGRLERTFQDQQNILLTSSFIPTNRHDKLLGITANNHHPQLHASSHEVGEDDELALTHGQISDFDTEVNALIDDVISGLTHEDISDFDTEVNSLIGAASINTSKLTGDPIPNSLIADDITLTNITQITNRSHTSLSDIGTNAHSAIDTFIASKGEAEGLATLDTLGYIPSEQIPAYLITGLNYQGDWDASGGTYPSTSGLENGDYYICSVGGTVQGQVFTVGDLLIYNADAEGYDSIKDLDENYIGYSVKTAELIAGRSQLKNLCIRGKAPWEVPYVILNPLDWTLGTEYQLFYSSDNGNTTVTIVNSEDGFNNVLKIVPDSSGSGDNFVFGVGDGLTWEKDLSGYTMMCMDFWVKCNYLYTGIDTIFEHDTTKCAFCRIDNNSGNYRVRIYKDVLSTLVATYTTSIALATWTHFSFRAYKSAGTCYVKTYINNALQGTATCDTITAFDVIALMLTTECGSSRYTNLCAIGSNAFNENYVHLSNYVTGYSQPIISTILDSGDSFSDVDTALMTAAAINDRILALALTNPLSASLTIGVGAASTDYYIKFDGETNDGYLYWMEDEDYFKFTKSLVIGDGAAGVDYSLTFNGETTDGVLTWMEDEDYFKFSDDVFIDSTEKLYFLDTNSYIYTSATTHLNLYSSAAMYFKSTGIDLYTAAAAASGSISWSATANSYVGAGTTSKCAIMAGNAGATSCYIDMYACSHATSAYRGDIHLVTNTSGSAGRTILWRYNGSSGWYYVLMAMGDGTGIRVYEPTANAKYVNIQHNATDGIINTSSGTLLFQLAGTTYMTLSSTKLDFNTAVMIDNYYGYNTTVGATRRDAYFDNTGLLGYYSSSKRFKENIEDLYVTDEEFLSLHPVKFNRIDDPKKKLEFGFIAEEINAIYPHTIYFKSIDDPVTHKWIGEDPNIIDGFEQQQLIAVLTMKLQEAIKRIDKLETLIGK